MKWKHKLSPKIYVLILKWISIPLAATPYVHRDVNFVEYAKLSVYGVQGKK